MGERGRMCVAVVVVGAVRVSDTPGNVRVSNAPCVAFAATLHHDSSHDNSGSNAARETNTIR